MFKILLFVFSSLIGNAINNPFKESSNSIMEENTLVWENGNQSLYKIGSSLPVVTGTTEEQGRASIVTLSTGDILIAWSGSKSGNYDIYAKGFNENLQTKYSWKINNETEQSQRFPSIGVFDTGNFAITWDGNQIKNSNDIYAKIYDASNSILKKDYRVNNATEPKRQSKACLAVIKTGDFVVAWQDFLSGGEYSSIYAKIYDANGNQKKKEFRVSNHIQSLEVSIAPLHIEGFVLSWHTREGEYPNYNNRNVQARIYNSIGEAITGYFRVNDNTTGEQSDSDIATLMTSNFVITWHSNQTGDYDIYAKIYRSNGEALTKEFRVNDNTTGEQDYPKVISLDIGGFLITWRSNQTGKCNVHAKVFDDYGNGIQGEFEVNDVTAQSEASRKVPMATNKKNGFVAIWHDDKIKEIYMQKFEFGTPSPTKSPTDFPSKSPTKQPTISPNAFPERSEEISPQFAKVGHPYVFSVPVEKYFKHNDGDKLTLSAFQEPEKSLLPLWLSFNNETNEFKGTPKKRDIGTRIIKVIASDGRGGEVSSPFVLEVQAKVTLSDIITIIIGGAGMLCSACLGIQCGKKCFHNEEESNDVEENNQKRNCCTNFFKEKSNLILFRKRYANGYGSQSSSDLNQLFDESIA